MTSTDTAPSTIRIATRFNGPFDSGNGGYSAGLAARELGAGEGKAVEATIRAPIPLDRTLRCHPEGDGLSVMTDDAENRILIMSLQPTTLETPAIVSPGLNAAREAAKTFRSSEDHVLPKCFVCGPDRRKGDGLRIFTDWVAKDDNPNDFPIVAAPWFPSSDLADANGLIAPEFLWAALDCPGAFALDAQPIVLGKITARIDMRPGIEDAIIAVAWKRGAEGRKHFASTALFDISGALLALSEQTWILIDAHKAAKQHA